MAQSTESSGIVFAGINSSTAAQNAGRNEHLRSFELRYPPRKKTEPEATDVLNAQALWSKAASQPLSRVSLFTPSSAAKKETYQRVLRLSRPMKGNGDRLGVISTGLAPEGEIVAFDADAEAPTSKDVVCRILLGKGEEASDIDIIMALEGGHHLAYCTNHEVYVTNVSRKGGESSDPRLIYGTPPFDAFASSKVRPKFRSLRFLTQNLLLLLQNRPNRAGAELLLLEIPSPPSLGNIVLRKRLHTSIEQATSLSVSLLPAPNLSQNFQSAIAVAGLDNSLAILTLDHPYKPPYSSSKFRKYALLRNVHDLQITSVTLSLFCLPSDCSTAPPQCLKLASTSINSFVIVHTLPLTPYPLPSASKRPSRYVLTTPGRSESTQMTLSVLISALVIAFGAFLLQAFTEIRGGTPEYLGAKGWLNDRIHGWIARPYMFEDTLEQLNVPGVETRPMKGVQSQVGEIKNSVGNALKQPKVEVPVVQTRSLEDIKSQAAESVENLREHGGKVKVGGGQANKRAKKSAEQAQQSVADAEGEAKDEAKARATAAQEKLGLRDLLSRRPSHSNSATSQEPGSDIIIRHDEASKALSADVRGGDTVITETHKKWEDLEHHERET